MFVLMPSVTTTAPAPSPRKWRAIAGGSATPSSAMLVEIRLTKPSGTIAGGLLTLTQQEDGLISATGVATWARLVNGNDLTALDLDCSGTDGTGDVKLASTNLYLGGDARMVSAILG